MSNKSARAASRKTDASRSTASARTSAAGTPVKAPSKSRKSAASAAKKKSAARKTASSAKSAAERKAKTSTRSKSSAARTAAPKNTASAKAKQPAAAAEKRTAVKVTEPQRPICIHAESQETPETKFIKASEPPQPLHVYAEPAKPVLPETPGKPAVREEPAKPVLHEEPAKPAVREEDPKPAIREEAGKPVKASASCDADRPKKRPDAVRVLFVTPECVPFASSGGLGEVAGSLPKKLAEHDDIDCRVIMPLYGAIGCQWRSQMEYLGNKFIPVAWRSKYMGVFRLEKDGVTYYFIDNEEYFKREGLYGYYDDCERFAFFSRAVFEALPIIGFDPQILHANDWQSALVPIYQDTIYHRNVRTIFSIHNVEYQGRYGTEVIRDVLGLPEGADHLVE